MCAGPTPFGAVLSDAPVYFQAAAAANGQHCGVHSSGSRGLHQCQYVGSRGMGEERKGRGSFGEDQRKGRGQGVDLGGTSMCQILSPLSQTTFAPFLS